MTKRELVEKYYDDIKDQLKICSENAMRSNGKVRFAIYAGEYDGVQVLEDVSGGDAKLDDPDMVLITAIDYGMTFNPANYLPYDTDVPEDADDEEWEEVEDDHLSTDVDEGLINRLITETDWDGKMDEIIELTYYERNGE